MDFFRTMERINLMHKLIKLEETGTPNSLAKRLGVSRGTLYNMLDELRSYNAPISYSRHKETFYYTQYFNLELHCDIEFIEKEQELKKINGGCSFLPPSIFFDGRELILHI